MTRQHNDECKTVLRLMGIPYIDVSVVILSSSIMIAIQVILDRHQWRTLHKIFGGEIFNMYAFGVRLRFANLSNILLGISNSLFNYCNVTIYSCLCFPRHPVRQRHSVLLSWQMEGYV